MTFLSFDSEILVTLSGHQVSINDCFVKKNTYAIFRHVVFFNEDPLQTVSQHSLIILCYVQCQLKQNRMYIVIFSFCW